MLNDDKSITTSTVALDGALSIYRRKFKLISLVLLIIGAIGLITYIVAGTLYEKEPLWVKFMLAFAVPFTLGLIGFITIIRLDRRAKTDGHKANCTFYSDCFFYNIGIISQYNSKFNTFLQYFTFFQKFYFEYTAIFTIFLHLFKSNVLY